eukprot:5847358-Amphidinium_carterae.1
MAELTNCPCVWFQFGPLDVKQQLRKVTLLPFSIERDKWPKLTQQPPIINSVCKCISHKNTL